jgi:hypothetical protein
MARDDPPKRRASPETKAQSLLRRFPIVDLAKAVFLTGSERRAFLERFVATSTTMSYMPTRDVFAMIYAAQGPLLESAPEPWNIIERQIRRLARPDIIDANISASKILFDFIRSQHYVATQCNVQVLRVRLLQVVKIQLGFYVTEGDRLLFQFPIVRRECLDDSAIRVLGSVVHHAYAHGDFVDAEIEIADISCQKGSNERYPRIRPVPRVEIYDRESLTDPIADVYAILAEIATRPPKPPDRKTPMDF